MGETTVDTLYSGALEIEQPRSGYRVNVDALLLAWFAARGRASVCLDLGAGVGSIALALRHLGVVRRLELLEIDPKLAEISRNNLVRTGALGKVHVVDLGRDGLPRALRAQADLVVCNPPFFEAHQGRATRKPALVVARVGSLAPFLRAAALALRGRRARAAFVYPARSLEPFLSQAEREGLVAKRLCLVHPDQRSPARVVMVELRQARAGGLVVEPPLLEWASKGVRSPELERILSGQLPK